jgi:hypothetical protein
VQFYGSQISAYGVTDAASVMKKPVVSVPALDAGAPYSLCACYGDMIYVAGLPPFDADFSKKFREARASASPQPALARTRLQAGRLPMNYMPTD